VITFITHMRARAGKAAELDAVLEEMAAAVRRTEPGVAWYDFARDAADPDAFVVVEVYRDAEAFWAHGQTEHIKASLPKSAALVEGGYDIRQYVSPGTEPVRPQLGADGVAPQG
jgi:quinol monooxygenase YgiN